MNKKIILNFMGIIFLILGISAIINTIYHEKIGLAPIIWLCYIGIILISLAVLTRNSLLLLSQINILAIPLITWNIDFYSILIFNKSLFNIADYFFIAGPIIGKIITSQHLFTIPLSIYALYLMKTDKSYEWKIHKDYAWIISFLQVSLIFFITRIISNEEKNINCVFKSCIKVQFGYYPLVWFSIFFIIIFITNLIIINLIFLKKKPST